jgi:hypothetical protein
VGGRPTAPDPLPLSREGLTELLGSRAPDEWVDLRGSDLDGAELSGMRFERVVFGLHGATDGVPPATLRDTCFRHCVLVDCKLAGVECAGTDFRLARLEDCDMRYASFSRGTFADATLVGCDLYRSAFEQGVVLENAVLECVSLNKATLHGIVDLGSQSFQQRAAPALVQEDEQRYRAFLERTVQDRPDDVAAALSRRLEEAARTYRALSGLWSGQGYFPDAAWAYVRTKRLERCSASPRHSATPTRWLRWLGLGLADMLCAFGESLARVLAWVAALAVVPGFVYWATGGVKPAAGGGDASLADCLLFSAGRLTASTPEHLSAATPLVEWAGVVQTLLGIALLGLLGFVLGNKLRSS